VGEPLALDAAWLFAAFLVILVLAAIGIATRRHLLERGGATVECGLRPAGGSWRLGVASYELDEFCWYGVFRISMRPEQCFPRRDLAVVSRRLPTDAEESIFGADRVVVECQLGESSPPGPPGTPDTSAGSGAPDAPRIIELALPESALTGLLAWLEAAPPGSHLDLLR
jgi:Protein of unknown function (DUF2550)